MEYKGPLSQFGIIGLQGEKFGIMGLHPVWNRDYRNQIWNWDDFLEIGITGIQDPPLLWGPEYSSNKVSV